ncbi:MAG: thioredoxin domain-containing protein [Bdellovibrionales bacterium]|nr:thioredoxin domain-containing protein [Bdellovibrionales bacterium]
MVKKAGPSKNRLSKEQSPYLKQHENNPVDWYAWGPEALKKAKDENKPILLSVGYSACHWCHVMAHESFENEETAKLMNEYFVNIKVDREERPDLDQIYQNVAQVMTQGGGWPLTVFLTPDLKPFFGGTYFPPEDRYGRPGFPRLLKALADAYKNQRENVDENAAKLLDAIEKLESTDTEALRDQSRHSGGLVGSAPKLALKDLESVSLRVLQGVDFVEGGMIGAPKFPNTMTFQFLWRMSKVSSVEGAREGALVALTKMARGGIFDQIGGGFHRYSVDDLWAVPHFEKMLYDNALLLKLYGEVLATDSDLPSEIRDLFESTLQKTLTYLDREMRTPFGLFMAAQDADSEGHEGKFFVWNPQQLEDVLGNGPDLDLAKKFYGVDSTGNFEGGMTVPYQAKTLSEISASSEDLERIRQKLFKARSQRVRPGDDDKALVGWNGLLISGLLWAGMGLARSADQGRKKLGQESVQWAEEVLNHLVKLTRTSETQRLPAIVTEKGPRLNGYLDDYAFMAQAALDLSRFSKSAETRSRALDLSAAWVDAALSRFEDDEGGFFFTSDDHEKLIQRPKSVHDQAIPSGTAVLLQVAAALSEILEDDRASRFRERTQFHTERLAGGILRRPFGSSEFLCHLLQEVMGPIAVSGPDSGELFESLGQATPFTYWKKETQKWLVCHQQACGAPLDSVEDVKIDVRMKVKPVGA